MDKKEGDLIVYKIILFTVALIPLWWLLGGKIFIFQLASLAILLKTIKNNRTVDKPVKYLIGCIIVYSSSILLALIRNPLDANITTVLAQVYILSYWIMGLAIIAGVNMLKEISIEGINRGLKGFFIFGIATIALFIISVAIWKLGLKNEHSYGLISKIWPDNFKIDMFEEMMQINHSVLDIIYRSETGVKEIFYRFNGFYAYPTEGAIATLIVLVYSILYFDLNNFMDLDKKNHKIFKYIFIILLLVAIYLFRSRTIILGGFISLIVVFIISKINKENFKRIVSIFLGIGIAFIILGFITGIFDKLLNMRPGSNSVRLLVYKNTIKTFVENPFGVGMPFRVDGLEIPIGSHSTYLGVLMKGGIVGFISIITFKVILFIQVFKNKKYITNKINKKIWISTTYILVISSIWMMIDDLDWPIIMAFFYFINCSLIFKFKDITINPNYLINLNNRKIALVGSSGGHLTHLIQMKDWWKDKERFWVTFNKADATSQLKDEKVYWCYYPTNRNFKNLIKNTFLALRVILIEKPDIIVSSGAGSAIPFFYLGKLFGIKLIYMEVYDRIDSPTLTGKIVYPICDEFIVQWEEQLEYYPKAKMLGGLF